MNVERGFRRITLLLSIVVGLGIWLISSFIIFSVWEDEHLQYNKCEEDYDNIQWFWSVWDANGWDVGNRSVIQHLLDSKDAYKLAPFKKRDETIYLKPEQVFPGIKKSVLENPPDFLNWTAQNSKSKALKEAREKVRRHRKWGNKKISEMIALSVVTGLPIGAAGFIVIWLIFFLLRWLVRGFCGDMIYESDKNKTFVNKKVVKAISRIIVLFLLYTLVVVVWVFLAIPSLDNLLSDRKIRTGKTSKKTFADFRKDSPFRRKPTFEELITRPIDELVGFDSNEPNQSGKIISTKELFNLEKTTEPRNRLKGLIEQKQNKEK